MKIAIAQTIAHSDFEKNFETFQAFTQKAKALGAELIVFPEMAYFSAKKKDWMALAPQYPKLIEQFQGLAKSVGLAILPGTLREPTKNPEKFYNTLCLIDSSGKVISQYRKIFLYQAVLPEKTYDETEYSEAGNQMVTVEWQGIKLGFAICFDLRFPELFRALKKRGAQVVFLPSAFTVPTGQAHWEILIRARAIENQFFMVAPGLTGTSGDGTTKYGHSMVVNPWGEILANLQLSEGIAVIEIETSKIIEAESKVPAWSCRREEILPIP